MFGFLGRKRLKVESRSICDRGLVRADNQDALVDDVSRAFFCVADGMGGGEGGALASRMVCDALRTCSQAGDLKARVLAVDGAISSANAAIRKVSRERGLANMGTTVAALLIDPVEPARAAIVSMGDSRVYRRRGIRLACMTCDHRHSEYSHLLTKAVGSAEVAEPDWLDASACADDVWLLCSDGVHEMIPDSTINALIAKGGSASDIAERISESVRRAGARDNYSIVVVRT